MAFANWFRAAVSWRLARADGPVRGHRIPPRRQPQEAAEAAISIARVMPPISHFDELLLNDDWISAWALSVPLLSKN